MSERKWSVYTLADSRAPDEIRYVGITCRCRLRLTEHKKDKTDTYRSRWIRSVLREGGDLVMTVISSDLGKDAANAMEVDLIARYRADGKRLTNSTAGGDGVVDLTPESLRKMSIAVSRAWTDERRAARISLNSDPEIRAKVSAGRKAWWTPDRKAEQSRKLQGRIFSDATRKKISDGKTGGRLSADHKAKIGAASRGKVRSLATRMKIAEAMRAANTNARLTNACRKSAPRSSLGLKGIKAHKSGRFEARIRIDGKLQYLGVFATARDAALAHDRAAFNAFGSGCYLNFPEQFAA